MARKLERLRDYLVAGTSHMADKKIRIKASELRAMIREALNQNIASRQSMMVTADGEDEDKEPNLHDGKGKEQLNDADEVAEVAPPGYEKVVKGIKKNKDVDNPWAVAWSMKNKGIKPKHESKESNEAQELEEFHDYEHDFVEKLSDKKYEMMATEIYNAWKSRDVDVDWAGVVDLYARNQSKNLGQKVDKTKLYEKVLDLVEKGPASDIAGTGFSLRGGW